MGKPDWVTKAEAHFKKVFPHGTTSYHTQEEHAGSETEHTTHWLEVTVAVGERRAQATCFFSELEVDRFSGITDDTGEKLCHDIVSAIIRGY